MEVLAVLRVYSIYVHGKDFIRVTGTELMTYLLVISGIALAHAHAQVSSFLQVQTTLLTYYLVGVVTILVAGVVDVSNRDSKEKT
jgi:sorbitol-specific phosphotransferase system component IIC